MYPKRVVTAIFGGCADSEFFRSGHGHSGGGVFLSYKVPAGVTTRNGYRYHARGLHDTLKIWTVHVNDRFVKPLKRVYQ